MSVRIAHRDVTAVRVVLRILRYTLSYKRQLILVNVAIFGTLAFALAQPQLIEWAVNKGLDAGEIDQIGADIRETLLVVAGLALVGAALLRGVFQFSQQYMGEWLGQTVAYDLRNEVYRRLQGLSFAYHDQAETGQIMVRATQDVEVIRMGINLGIIRLGFVALLMVFLVVIMAVTSWLLALVAWAFLVVIGVRSWQMSRKLRPIWTDVQEGQARLGTVLQEALTGVRVVKAFSRERRESEKFGHEAGWLFRRSHDASKVQAINSPILTALWMGSLVAVAWLGGTQVINGDLTLGALTKFLLYLQLLQQPVRHLGFMATVVPRMATAGGRVFEIIDQESAVQERADAREVVDPQGHIQFENVSFAYSAQAPVLRDVSFEARPGEVVALLGPTGSGKSTVVNLIPRFYDISGGAVRFDGVDIRDLQVEALRRQVAVVQQDVFLFAATIRDNIAYGRLDATPEEVEAAARVGRIHDFIVTLPDAYDTWVGERGVTLSGGQKQRVAIARALLMDPRVLIFDDSTSSVDTRTEYEIQLALNALMEGRTTFIIAHRLRSVREADQILVLDEGRIVQRGRHGDLLAQGGLYRTIYDLELRDQEEAYARPAAAGGGSG